LAPFCAFCPSTVAACEPTAHASGWREQNWRASDTAALAAEMASLAPTCGADGVDSPAGKNMTTMVSQKAAFNRNLTALPFPSRLFCLSPHGTTLAHGHKEPVRLIGCIWRSLEFNLRQIFR
jgi:hypothetical protein